MKKVAIAVMLLATASFAATITVEPASQMPGPGGKVTFTFNLENPGQEMITGYTITQGGGTGAALLKTASGTGTTAVLAQNAAVAGTRAIVDGALTDPTATALQLVGASTGTTGNFTCAGKLLSAITNDLGMTSSDAASVQKVDGGPLVTYTFYVQGTLTAPVTVIFRGGTTFTDGTFDDGGLPNLFDGPAWTQTVTITPEPASMLLVAAGAAFFARRRKA